MQTTDPPDRDGAGEVDDTFATNLDFDQIIDRANWQTPGEYYQSMPAATRAVVTGVVEGDERLRQELRNEWLPELLRRGTVRCWERANPRYIESLQRKRLYSGRVVCADGTVSRYETLSLVSAQLAISRVSYQGTTGQFVCNIMHWGAELPRRATAADIVQAIQSRGRKLADHLPNLFLHALETYKERQVLLNTPPGTFKLIQGPVFPYEMLSGSGKQFIMRTCLDLLADMIEDGSYANIVSKDTHRELLALGMALDAGEYMIVATGTEILTGFRRDANYTSTSIEQYGGKSQIQIFEDFQNTYGPKVVQGVLRAHRLSPPYVFYCNADRLPEAVHMLLADAANTGARGFPLLVDLADQYCSGAFRAGEYTSHMNSEFARASGGSGMYQSERTTRD